MFTPPRTSLVVWQAAVLLAEYCFEDLRMVENLVLRVGKSARETCRAMVLHMDFPTVVQDDGPHVWTEHRRITVLAGWTSGPLKVMRELALGVPFAETRSQQSLAWL
mmetsp:Transcript_8682/g.15884  ORF Transcript_8682/g.15884 Transcript_8682/m.15884 type:complete len:107 (-) Transcript_8682:236-556(-)